jgi:hypothetical protein
MTATYQNSVIQELNWSLHGGQRRQQRGFKSIDPFLLQTFGERVEDGYLMTNQSINQAQHALKQLIQRLDHLKGAALIEEGNTVVTCYRADKKRIRRLRAGHVETQASNSHQSTKQ